MASLWGRSAEGPGGAEVAPYAAGQGRWRGEIAAQEAHVAVQHGKVKDGGHWGLDIVSPQGT